MSSRFAKVISLVLVAMFVLSFGQYSYATDDKDKPVVENEYLKQIAREFYSWGFSIILNADTIAQIPDYDKFVSARPYELESNDREYGEFSRMLMTTACDIGKLVRYRNDNFEANGELESKAMSGLMDMASVYINDDLNIKPVSLKNTGDDYISFTNVKVEKNMFGIEFSGLVVNHHPSMTFSGFGEVVLYDKNNEYVDSISMGINNTSPHRTSVFGTLPVDVDFEYYDILVTVPIWE